MSKNSKLLTVSMVATFLASPVYAQTPSADFSEYNQTLDEAFVENNSAIVSGSDFTISEVDESSSIFQGYKIGEEGALEVKYYKYEIPTSLRDSISPDLSLSSIRSTTKGQKIEGYFLNSTQTDVGGAINNTSAMDNITADFIGNKGMSGGAIYNGMEIKNILGDFIGNASSNFNDGGAIYNTYIIENIRGNFIDNQNLSAANGGAILNGHKITSITANFINNGGKTNSGGAIHNKGSITDLNSNFFSNTASYGGALSLTEAGTITNLKGLYAQNIAKSYGGAIHNKGIISNVDADFVKNQTAQKSELGGGGAIANYGKFTNLAGQFIENTSDMGGGIYNLGADAEIENLTANFYRNSARNTGGAIFNKNGNIANIKSVFVENSSVFGGGAIYNETGTIGKIESSFSKNISSNGSGGAIYNAKTIGDIFANFSSNSANSAGALFNGGSAKIDNLTADFYSNSAVNGNGGALLNGGIITNIKGIFGENTSGADGAGLYNSGTITSLESNFTDNVAKGKGGAIYNSKIITDISGEFHSNKAANGGAIYNDKANAVIENLKADFYSNATSGTTGSGGAVYNYGGKIVRMEGAINSNSAAFGGGIFNAGTIENLKSNVIGNIVTSSGGGIYNSSNILNVESYFSSNKAAYGGAIYTKGGLITNLQADFYANSATYYGGAIYSADASKITNIKGSFAENSSAYSGGAIYNLAGEIEEIDGDFVSNKAGLNGGAIYNSKKIGDIVGGFGSNSSYSGGAIYNTGGSIASLESDFVKNAAGSQGGAIHNNSGGSIARVSGVFDGNFVRGKGDVAGGAVYNDAKIEKIYNSSFINNYVESVDDDKKAQGGAIYSTKDLFIEADSYTSEFSGNYVKTNQGQEANAIYMAKSGDDFPTLTFASKRNGAFNIKDSIDGDEGYRINFIGDGQGVVNIESGIKNASIIIDDVPTEIQSNARLANSGFIVNVSKADLLSYNNSLNIKNGTLNIFDFGLSNLKFNDLKLNGGSLNVSNLGVDLAAKQMGSLSADNVTGENTQIKISSVYINSDSVTPKTSISFAEDNILAKKITTSVMEEFGPVFKYKVTYDKETGEFIFTRGLIPGEFNPEVLASSVSSVAVVSVLSDEIYSRVLADVDNTCGSVSCSRVVSGAFVKTFGSEDSIDLDNFEGADTNFNGIIAGVNSERINEGKGISAIYQAYVAYANGESKFSSEKVGQNGYYLGVSANFYKGRGFVGTTANVATIRNESKAYDGNYKFSSYLAGAAIKVGYNFDAVGLVVQPNLYGSYTFINSNNYTTGRGAKVVFDNMYSVELAPGLKIAKEFDGGLTAYTKVRYVYTFNEGQEVHANGFLLPEVSLKPYAEYGIGVEKALERTSGFVEITRRDGGREGWNGILGIKYKW